MAMQPPVHANRHMVSAGHILAAEAGYAVLEGGGNAIDAGVAAGIALGVVHSDMVQVAGVAPIMIRLARERRVVTVSGLGWWPRAASLERLAREFDGHVPIGILRTVVPAAPDAWILALRRWGTMSFGEVAQAAIRYAREGFPMHHVMRDYIAANAETYRLWPQNADIYLPGNAVPAEGAPFVQEDLGRSLQFMADEERAAAGRGGREAGLEAARAAFYLGDLAQAMARYHAENGGWLTREDLAEYRSAVEPPVRVRLGELDVYTCGPWCQGPTLAQMVRMVDGLDLAGLGHNSPAYVHTLLETMKLCFADRERYLGDPRFVDVPLGTLLSDPYIEARRGQVRPDAAWPDMPPPGEVERFGARVEAPGTWPPEGWEAGTAPGTGDGLEAPSPPAPADTSYCCAVDGEGNLFSATPSDVSWEAPIIPGTGLCPSTRGSQSWAVPGHPSALAPGKRPRLTPNPAIAVREGRLAMPFGTPGGDNQTQAMLQVLLNVAVFGMRIQDAIEAPRFMTHSFPNSFEPHASLPGKATVEGRIPEEVTRRLSALGHDIERLPDLTYRAAGVCAITVDLQTGIMEGGADPRRMSRAVGR